MAEAKPEAAPSSGNASKVAIQLTKLRDANVKYKTLLKKAKERIEQQEEELKQLKGKSRLRSACALAETYDQP